MTLFYLDIKIQSKGNIEQHDFQNVIKLHMVYFEVENQVKRQCVNLKIREKMHNMTLKSWQYSMTSKM